MRQGSNRASDHAPKPPPTEANDLEHWRAALRSFRDGLVASRQALGDDQNTDSVHPWPPPHLPSSPLPTELVEEARALIAEADKLTMELADAMADVKLDGRSRSRASYGRAGQGAGQQHARWSFDA